MGITYKDAGVDIDLFDRFIAGFKEDIPAIGGFSGAFPIQAKKYRNPLLVASTDGVGTKLLLALELNRYSTIGIDLVAMVVNDIITCGATPLFFLDYFATQKLLPKQAKPLFKGIIKGCELAGCPLIGGETAELPGIYEHGHFDLAGFGVGVVEKKKIIDGHTIKSGDTVMGLRSSGLHSNGYSLARRVLLEINGLDLRKRVAPLTCTLGTELLRPTIIYVNYITSLLTKVTLKGIANITGGGIPGNLVRILPQNADAVIDVSTWKPQPIFSLIQRGGNVASQEMFKTFNMGIGMIIVVDSRDSSTIHTHSKKHDVETIIIGEIRKGRGRVLLEGLDA